MLRIFTLGLISLGLFACGCTNESKNAPAASAAAMGDTDPSAAWAVTMDNIEACSCPAFCQCYFTGQPALHEAVDHASRYCRFSNAFRVVTGHSGSTNLDGMKIWMAGDLGGDFSKGQMDWAVLRFEPTATPQQREAAAMIVKAIFPVKWNSFTVGPDAKIDWQKTNDGASAKLNDGKSGEILMKTLTGQEGKPVKIENAQFWAARSGNLSVMKTEVEAYRDGDKPYEFKGTNGFLNTIRMSASDVKTPSHASATHRLQILQAGAAGCTTGDCCN